ncbi:hypothetical protein [Arthrobacter sp. MMS18-M83]|uniref:hypothetical protein n=1 Tax=Arthrobacter sp. MMS18-M83 TaxID=2996261 RepID=UPI00227D2583|nr:hypothetical protein [Arthrobacter sp. MMS18-M83]WAH95920.1 hypothetical protein OW521_15955 [Arthrobacter sp. MMS18-M83]
MTALGIFFALIYVFGMIKGQRALLIGVACAVPFNDSAMIVAGDVTVTPFYVGLVLYLIITIIGQRKAAFTGPGRNPSRLLIPLFVYGLFITIFGPRLFEGMAVIASGMGLDEQVGHLSSLAPSLSNFAQIAYLGLALIFVGFNERRSFLGPAFLLTAFTVGTLVAFAAFVVQKVGIVWPQLFFDNSPRGFYAIEPLRLRGQFSEPSHLGAFALAACIYFIICLFRARLSIPWLGYLLMTGVSIVVFTASSSGTGIVGGIIAAAVMAVMGMVRIAKPGTKLRPSVVIASLFLLSGGVFAIPGLASALWAVIIDKQGGGSFVNRGLADEIAYGILWTSDSLGIGLGSNRSSSLWTMLLSTIGIVGTSLFVAVVLVCFRRSFGLPERLPAALSLVGFVSAAFVSFADFASPIMWSLICFCFAARSPIPETDLSSTAPGPLASAKLVFPSGRSAELNRVSEPSVGP